MCVHVMALVLLLPCTTAVYLVQSARQCFTLRLSLLCFGCAYIFIHTYDIHSVEEKREGGRKGSTDVCGRVCTLGYPGTGKLGYPGMAYQWAYFFYTTPPSQYHTRRSPYQSLPLRSGGYGVWSSLGHTCLVFPSRPPVLGFGFVAHITGLIKHYRYSSM